MKKRPGVFGLFYSSLFILRKKEIKRKSKKQVALWCFWCWCWCFLRRKETKRLCQKQRLTCLFDVVKNTKNK